MMLLTKENIANLPEVCSQDGKGLDATAYVKFFGGGRWTYYVTEYDGDDTFFGYLKSGLGSDCDELCYMSFSELKSMRFPPFRLPVERDRSFKPQTIREAIEADA